MKKLLIVGVNTRPLACSAKKLGYEVYSASYFHTADFNCYHQEKHSLDQKPYHSCGYFADSFHPSELENLSKDWIDKVDHIITYTGISPESFPSSKILGNKKTKHIENKYKLFNNLKNKFKLPQTFLLSSIEEACEIAHQHPAKEFLLKPVCGSGGYGVMKLEDLINLSQLKINSRHDNSMEPKSFESCFKSYFTGEEFLLQEYMCGENVSSSILSNKKESKTVITSKQISGIEISGKYSGICSGINSNFIYGGNLVPYPGADNDIKKVSEEVINELSLIGSNGVDLILKDDEIYVIEVNPRFQGTFECAESALDINLIEAHINACNGYLMEINPPQRYVVKKILYAKERCRVGKINLPDVYDLPLTNTIIEEGEPLVTVLGYGQNPTEAITKANKTMKNVQNHLIPLKKPS